MSGYGRSLRSAGRHGSAGRIAGIDFGTVRIGIAVSDPDRSLASPLEIYTRRTPELDARRFRDLAAREGVCLWVVGLPVHLDGRESRKSLEARQFARWLAQTTGIPAELFDERFTSVEAEELLRDARLSSRRRKNRIDMVAAQILLTAYLQSQSKGREPPGAIDDD